MLKSCGTCDYYEDYAGVCTNGDSDHRADFVAAEHTCDKWEEIRITEIKDSGDRTEFSTGAVRDMGKGKGRCDLLPPRALLRLARHFEAGAEKYGDRNWEQGIPISSFIDSGIRHILKYMAGETDEDHLVAAAWNLICAQETEEVRPEMQDLPGRKG